MPENFFFMYKNVAKKMEPYKFESIGNIFIFIFIHLQIQGL